MPGTVCPCGKPMFDDRGACPLCLQHHQARQSRPTTRMVLNVRPAPSTTTPPPSHASTPRRSLDQRPHSARPTARDAMQSGFTTADEDAGADMFPTSFYSRPPRVASPRASPHWTASASHRPSITPHEHGSAERPMRQPTPDVLPMAKAGPARSYSPMAAGFARLNRPVETSRRLGAGGSDRQSLDLDARMFDGPA